MRKAERVRSISMVHMYTVPAHPLHPLFICKLCLPIPRRRADDEGGQRLIKYGAGGREEGLVVRRQPVGKRPVVRQLCIEQPAIRGQLCTRVRAHVILSWSCDGPRRMQAQGGVADPRCTAHLAARPRHRRRSRQLSSPNAWMAAQRVAARRCVES